MTFRTKDNLMGNLSKSKILEFSRNTFCRSNNRYPLACRFLNVLIAAIGGVGLYFSRTTATSLRIVQGRLEGIFIIFMSRFNSDIRDQIWCTLIPFSRVIHRLVRLHYLYLISLSLMPIVGRIGIRRILKTVRRNFFRRFDLYLRRTSAFG